MKKLITVFFLSAIILGLKGQTNVDAMENQGELLQLDPIEVFSKNHLEILRINELNLQDKFKTQAASIQLDSLIEYDDDTSYSSGFSPNRKKTEFVVFSGDYGFIKVLFKCLTK